MIPKLSSRAEDPQTYAPNQMNKTLSRGGQGELEAETSLRGSCRYLVPVPIQLRAVGPAGLAGRARAVKAAQVRKAAPAAAPGPRSSVPWRREQPRRGRLGFQCFAAATAATRTVRWRRHR